MKKTTKKLSLKKVTVKLLANNEAKALAGGTVPYSTVCSTHCPPTQNGCSNNSCGVTNCHEN